MRLTTASTKEVKPTINFNEQKLIDFSINILIKIAIIALSVTYIYWSSNQSTDFIYAFVTDNQLDLSQRLGLFKRSAFSFVLLSVMSLPFMLLHQGKFRPALSLTVTVAALISLLPLLAFNHVQLAASQPFTMLFVSGLWLLLAWWLLAAIEPNPLFQRLGKVQVLNTYFPKFCYGLAMLGFLVYFLYFSARTILNHINFETHAFDLGIFEHMFYNLSRFKGGYTTVHFKDQILQDNFSPIFYLVTPLYMLFRSPYTLLVIQAFALGISSLIIYKLAFLKTQNAFVSLALSLSFMAHPALHGINLYDFHEIALFPPLILWSIYQLERGHNKLFFLFLVLDIMCKEEAALFGFAVGLYVLLSKRAIKLGWVGMVFCALYYIIATKYILPATELNGRFSGMFSNGLDGMGSMVVTLFTNPLFTLQYVFGNPEKVLFWLYLLSPVLFLPLLSKRWAFVIMLPAAFISLLSSYAYQYKLGWQYPAGVLPFIYIVAADALAIRPAKQYFIWGSLIMLASFIIHDAHGSLLNMGLLHKKAAQAFPRQTINDVISHIPADAPVSAQSDILPHLTHRDKIYQFPLVEDATYFVVDLKYTSTFPLANQFEIRDELRKIINQNKFGLYYHKDKTYLFKQGADTSKTYVINRLECADMWFDSVLVRPEPDPQAWSSQVITAKPDGGAVGRHIVFGPYYKIQPGHFPVYFALKVADNRADAPCAELDIYNNGQVISARTLKPTDFKASNQYQLFDLTYRSEVALENVEFRIRYLGQTKLTADFVDIGKLHY